jgi:putative chitinase
MTDRVLIARNDWEALVALVETINRSVQPEEIVVTAPRPLPVAPADEDAGFAFADYGAFYDFLRGNKMLGPKISADEFSGCDSILRACATAEWGISWVAYALATTYHETAGTMQPIKELGGPAYFTKMYDIRGDRPAKARELGNLSPGDGARYPGRGYVQLTGKANYEKATAKLRALGYDVDLVADPNRAMEPEIAAVILVLGMREGWFTGRDIDDDLPASGPARLAQFTASRDIINGRDKQEMIAEYAVDFQTGLQQGGYKIAA